MLSVAMVLFEKMTKRSGDLWTGACDQTMGKDFLRFEKDTKFYLEYTKQNFALIIRQCIEDSKDKW